MLLTLVRQTWTILNLPTWWIIFIFFLSFQLRGISSNIPLTKRCYWYANDNMDSLKRVGTLYLSFCIDFFYSCGAWRKKQLEYHKRLKLHHQTEREEKNYQDYTFTLFISFTFISFSISVRWIRSNSSITKTFASSPCGERKLASLVKEIYLVLWHYEALRRSDNPLFPS